MKKNITFIFSALLSLLMMVSCNGLLDVTNPNSLNDEQVEDLLESGDDETIDLIVGGMASGMPPYISYRNSQYYGFTNSAYDNDYVINILRNLQAEDIVFASERVGESGWAQFYALNPQFTFWDNSWTDWNYGIWAGPALKLAAANKVLYYITDEALNNSDKLKDYKARCLVVRGLTYLELMERFRKAYLHGGREQTQGMPIYTAYAYNDVAAPLTPDETWTFIKEQFSEAAELFKASGIGTDGFTLGTSHDEIYDIDRGLAQFFYAKACLMTGDYANCIAACNDILDHYGWRFISEANYGGSFDDMAGLIDGTKEVKADDNAFLCAECNPEVIFGWSNDASLWSWSYLNSLAPGSGGYGQSFFQISDELYNKIADNDFRKTRWTSELVNYPYLVTIDGEETVENRDIYQYTTLKWAATIASGQEQRDPTMSNSDMIIYRTSEVLLMLAEAQAMSGNDAGAKTTLNRLLAARTKAGAPTLTCDNYPGMSGLSTIEMVKLQWRIEMWGENGLDFWNHKRWNEPVERTGTNHWRTNTLTVDHMTWEIPESELIANKHWLGATE